eukprot:1158297-Pelagomonas_calceolata.AAC.5
MAAAGDEAGAAAGGQSQYYCLAAADTAVFVFVFGEKGAWRVAAHPNPAVAAAAAAAAAAAVSAPALCVSLVPKARKFWGRAI